MPTLSLPTHAFPRAMLAACCAAVLVVGCSILPKKGAIQVWQPPEGDTAVAPVAANFSLRVATPNATGMLQQAGIVVMPRPGEMSVYQGARWSDAPALLVRRRLIDAFMAAGLPAVTTDDDHFFADFSLSGNLRTFQSEYRDGKPVVVVRFDAQLRRGGSRRLLATDSFVVTANPASTQVPAIVAAFGVADDKLASRVVGWVVAKVRAAPPRDSGPRKAAPGTHRPAAL